MDVPRLEDLPALDAILISHDHYDHLGEATVRGLAHLQPATRWITSLGVGSLLTTWGVRPDRIAELDWTESTRVSSAAGGVCTVTSLPARHFSGRSLRNRFETLWASFVLQGSGPETHRVYYGADSGLWDGFPEIGSRYGPFDLTMLEIGAYNDLWRSIHMGPGGAAEAFRAMGACGLLMPIHWGLFDLALHAWREPIQTMEELATQHGLALFQPAPGKPTDLTRGVAHRSGWWHEGATPNSDNRRR